MGGQTILQSHGKVVALGPDRVEHDVPTFSGNSGSPIILRKNGKVIGVHTVAVGMMNSTQADKYSRVQAESQIKHDMRFFGYRYDTIHNWQSVTLTQMLSFKSQLVDVRKALDDVSTGMARVARAKVLLKKLGSRQIPTNGADPFSPTAVDKQRDNLIIESNPLLEVIEINKCIKNLNKLRPTLIGYYIKNCDGLIEYAEAMKKEAYSIDKETL